MIVGILESQPPRAEENFNGRVGKVIFPCPSFVGENLQEVSCRRSERRALIGRHVEVKRGPEWLLCICVEDLDLGSFTCWRFSVPQSRRCFSVCLQRKELLALAKSPSQPSLVSLYKGVQSERWWPQITFYNDCYFWTISRYFFPTQGNTRLIQRRVFSVIFFFFTCRGVGAKHKVQKKTAGNIGAKKKAQRHSSFAPQRIMGSSFQLG